MRSTNKTQRIMPLLLITSIFFKSPLMGGILLNEISAGGAKDWVEVKLTADSAPVDISALFVTMYYGANEKISDQPVTLYPADRPETPWDDRFAVIHFTDSAIPDETDSAGDLNNDRVRDLYCINYGLWNTDCCLSIDSDDDPANNGIIDFAAFSNRDGSINSTIASYINSAVLYGMWQSCGLPNMQDCCVFTGSEGMNSYSTLSRVGTQDTDSMADFTVTPYSTPGRENITDTAAGRDDLLHPLEKRITYDYDKSGRAGGFELPLFLYDRASIRVRIFNAAGVNIYTGPLASDINPGYFTLRINVADLKGKLPTGLYPVNIEAVSSGTGRTQTCRLLLVLVRRR